MSDFILECSHVGKTFHKEGRHTEVLRDVNIGFRKGEMAAILGHSGAGKSTLLHLLGTLEPVTSGDILFNNESITKYRANQLAHFRNQQLGFVFQFHYLLPEFTALENVLMPAMIAEEPREKYERIAMELLEDVGLQDRAEHRPGELSGGEQQRVALARALIMNPKVILADEPTGNLDSENAERVKEMFFHLNESYGVTLILVTHDIDMAADFPRKVLMKDGQIVEDSAQHN